MKKFSTALNIYILVGLVVLVVLITQTLQNSQAPTSSSASGFGSEATRDLYVPTAELFSNTSCDSIFYQQYANNPSFPEISSADYDVQISQYPAQDDIPLHCLYSLSADKTVEFTVYSYREDSFIDNTRDDLFKRINTPSIKGSGIDSDVIGIMDYITGADSADASSCRTNLFHPLNDFEYASIVYTGFDCSKFTNLNREFVTIFGNYLVSSLDYVYTTYGKTTTADLLAVWGFSDRIVNLNFYTK